MSLEGLGPGPAEPTTAMSSADHLEPDEWLFAETGVASTATRETPISSQLENQKGSWNRFDCAQSRAADHVSRNTDSHDDSVRFSVPQDDI